MGVPRALRSARKKRKSLELELEVTAGAPRPTATSWSVFMQQHWLFHCVASFDARFLSVCAAPHEIIDEDEVMSPKKPVIRSATL